MRRALAAAVVGLALSAAPAAAATKDTATVVGPSTAIVGQLAGPFSSTVTCSVACGHDWRAFGPGAGRLGAGMGRAPSVSYTFGRIGFWQAVYTLAEACVGSPRQVCSSQAVVYVSVTA